MASQEKEENRFVNIRRVIPGLLCLTLAVCALFFGVGSTYYVETIGSDVTGNGSITNPWQTVGHALSIGAGGDTINLGTGEFREFLLITNPITLNGANTYDPSQPPLQRHASLTSIRAPFASPSGRIITVATNNVTIQNLSIFGDAATNGTGSVLQGIYTDHRPATVYNCTIANIDGRAIECRGTNPPPAASDNDSFRSLFAYNLIYNISNSVYADGIFLSHTQATCERNEFSHINGLGAHAGIYISQCDNTTNMSAPITIRSNYFNDCAQAVWANDPVAYGETINITGNTVTNSLIGVRLSASAGQAYIGWNNIHVAGLSASGLTPARGIWIQADQDPWSVTAATDHVVFNNTLRSEATTNDGTVGMYFSYATQPPGSDNNGVRATVVTNYVYDFAIGALIESGSSGVSITNTPLVEVEMHYNDIFNSSTMTIMTTGFSYIVDATTNFLGYSDPSNFVSTNVNYTGWSMGSYTLDTDGDHFADYVDADDDGDGLLDTTEVSIGTFPNRSDSDFDGMSDPSEYYVAGTDPLDPEDRLIVNSFAASSTNISFEWPSVTGKTYYVYRTTNLVVGFGSPITNFPASTPTNYFSEPVPGSQTYFYHVSVTN